MPLSREDVLHLASLVRMSLTPPEVERLQEQLSNILEQFRILQELDTAGVPPTGHSVPLQSVMREDEVQPSFPQDDVLANAPRRYDEFFRVHVVLDE